MPRKFRALYSPNVSKEFRWDPTMFKETPSPFARPTNNEPQFLYMKTKNQQDLNALPRSWTVTTAPGYVPKDAPAQDPSNQQRSVDNLDRKENQDRTFVDQNITGYPEKQETIREELKRKIRERVRSRRM